MKKTSIIIAFIAAVAFAGPAAAGANNYNARAGGNGNGNGAANANCNSAHFFGSCDSGGQTYAAPAPAAGAGLMGMVLAGGLGAYVRLRRKRPESDEG